MVIGAGHALWGLAAYRRPILELVGAGIADGVGDGLFQKDHADDGRAAAFWFMFTAPMISLLGYLVHRSLRGGDRKAATVAGRTILGLGLVGCVVMPRSGFLTVPPVACWLLRQARRPETG